MMVKVFPSLLVTPGVDCKPVTSWFVCWLVGWLCVLFFCPVTKQGEYGQERRGQT